MKQLQVTSLRKGAAALEEAVESLRAGKRVAFPSECGFLEASWPAPSTGLRACLEPPPLADDPLQRLAQTFWPGPLWLRLPSPSGAGKQTWFVPAHPLARALLQALAEPVGAVLRHARGAPECELVLHWRDEPACLPPSELDACGWPWRWLRSGTVERREVEWLTGVATVLSGCAMPRPTENAPTSCR